MVQTAIIQTFFVNGSISILWFYFAFSIIKRGKDKPSNQMFFLFMFLTATGLMVNVAYRLINQEYWNIILNKVTIFLSSFAIVFLFLFNLIILKSDKVVGKYHKIVSILLWFLLCFGFFLFPSDSVTWYYNPAKPNDVGVPVWSMWFSLYGLIIDQGLFSMTLYIVAQIYRRFENPVLKKKYLWIIASIALFDWILVGNFIFNALNDPTGRLIFMLSSLLAIPASILLYLGVKRDIGVHKKKS